MFCLEPDTAIGPVRSSTKHICALIGLELAPDEEVAPALPAMLLGAQVTLPRGFAHSSIHLSKATKIIEETKDIIKANTISTSRSSKLRGELGFAQSLVFGLFGRALLKPIAERQYSLVRKRARIRTKLTVSLTRWASSLKDPEPRTVPLRPVRPFVVYTDACGEGCTGVTTHCHAPRWMSEA